MKRNHFIGQGTLTYVIFIILISKVKELSLIGWLDMDVAVKLNGER
jgi:hypothetical protein